MALKRSFPASPSPGQQQDLPISLKRLKHEAFNSPISRDQCPKPAHSNDRPTQTGAETSREAPEVLNGQSTNETGAKPQFGSTKSLLSSLLFHDEENWYKTQNQLEEAAKRAMEAKAIYENAKGARCSSIEAFEMPFTRANDNYERLKSSFDNTNKRREMLLTGLANHIDEPNGLQLVKTEMNKSHHILESLQPQCDKLSSKVRNLEKLDQKRKGQTKDLMNKLDKYSDAHQTTLSDLCDKVEQAINQSRSLATSDHLQDSIKSLIELRFREQLEVQSAQDKIKQEASLANEIKMQAVSSAQFDTLKHDMRNELETLQRKMNEEINAFKRIKNPEIDKIKSLQKETASLKTTYENEENARHHLRKELRVQIQQNEKQANDIISLQREIGDLKKEIEHVRSKNDASSLSNDRSARVVPDQNVSEPTLCMLSTKIEVVREEMLVIQSQVEQLLQPKNTNQTTDPVGRIPVSSPTKIEPETQFLERLKILENQQSTISDKIKQFSTLNGSHNFLQRSSLQVFQLLENVVQILRDTKDNEKLIRDIAIAIHKTINTIRAEDSKTKPTAKN